MRLDTSQNREGVIRETQRNVEGEAQQTAYEQHMIKSGRKGKESEESNRFWWIAVRNCSQEDEIQPKSKACAASCELQQCPRKRTSKLLSFVDDNLANQSQDKVKVTRQELWRNRLILSESDFEGKGAQKSRRKSLKVSNINAELLVVELRTYQSCGVKNSSWEGSKRAKAVLTSSRLASSAIWGNARIKGHGSSRASRSIMPILKQR